MHSAIASCVSQLEMRGMQTEKLVECERGWGSVEPPSRAAACRRGDGMAAEKLKLPVSEIESKTEEHKKTDGGEAWCASRELCTFPAHAGPCARDE